MTTATKRHPIVMRDFKDQEWADRAYRLLERMARRQQALHVNDLWDHMEKHRWPMPSNKKLLGHVLRAAAANGVIARTDVAILVKQERGSYWRPIWRSRIYKP